MLMLSPRDQTPTERLHRAVAPFYTTALDDFQGTLDLFAYYIFISTHLNNISFFQYISYKIYVIYIIVCFLLNKNKIPLYILN